MEAVIVFISGAAGYPLIELLWRGHTHWTMALVGGICFLLIYLNEKRNARKTLLNRCLTGCMIITVTELVCGIIVNKILGWDVWDYSDMPVNFMGQICITYSALWFLLVIPLIYLCTVVKKLFCERITQEFP